MILPERKIPMAKKDLQKPRYRIAFKSRYDSHINVKYVPPITRIETTKLWMPKRDRERNKNKPCSKRVQTREKT